MQRTLIKKCDQAPVTWAIHTPIYRGNIPDPTRSQTRVTGTFTKTTKAWQARPASGERERAIKSEGNGDRLTAAVVGTSAAVGMLIAEADPHRDADESDSRRVVWRGPGSRRCGTFPVQRGALDSVASFWHRILFVSRQNVPRRCETCLIKLSHWIQTYSIFSDKKSIDAQKAVNSKTVNFQTFTTSLLIHKIRRFLLFRNI